MEILADDLITNALAELGGTDARFYNTGLTLRNNQNSFSVSLGGKEPDDGASLTLSQDRYDDPDGVSNSFSVSVGKGFYEGTTLELSQLVPGAIEQVFNRASLSVGGYQPDRSAALSVSRDVFEDFTLMESTSITIGSGQDEGAIRLRRKDQSADLYLGEWGTSLVLGDPDTRSAAVMSTNNEGAILWLGQEDPMATLMANKEGAGLHVGLLESGLTHIDLSAPLNEGGQLSLYNERGDARSIISFTDKTGHGGIWLYDRYGDKSRSYTFYKNT